MYLTAQQMAQGRDYTLNNMLSISTVCLNAGQRLVELLTSGSREAQLVSSKHISRFGHGQLESLTQFPLALWLEHSSRASQLLGGAYEIVGEMHQMLIHSGEAQIRAVDDIVFSSIDRLTGNGPMDVELALNTGLHTEEMVEQDISPAGDSLPAKPEQKPKASPRSRSKAN